MKGNPHPRASVYPAFLLTSPPKEDLGKNGMTKVIIEPVSLRAQWHLQLGVGGIRLRIKLRGLPVFRNSFHKFGSDRFVG